MACPGGTHEQPQAAALLDGQLQAAERAAIQPLRPRHDGRHTRAAKRLVQRPKMIGLAKHVDDDHRLRLDPQPYGGRRIKLPPAVQDDECPARATRFSRRIKRQRFRAASRLHAEPLDQRPAAKTTMRQAPVQRLAATGNQRLAAGHTGPFQPGNLFLERQDNLFRGPGLKRGRSGIRFAMFHTCSLLQKRVVYTANRVSLEVVQARHHAWDPFQSAASTLRRIVYIRTLSASIQYRRNAESS